MVSEDLSQFASLPELEKRQRALQYLMAGLECVSKEYRWPAAGKCKDPLPPPIEVVALSGITRR